MSTSNEVEYLEAKEESEEGQEEIQSEGEQERRVCESEDQNIFTFRIREKESFFKNWFGCDCSLIEIVNFFKCIFTLGAYPKRNIYFDYGDTVVENMKKQNLYEYKARNCCLAVFSLMVSNILFILGIFRLRDLVEQNSEL